MEIKTDQINSKMQKRKSKTVKYDWNTILKAISIIYKKASEDSWGDQYFYEPNFKLELREILKEFSLPSRRKAK